MSEGAPPGTDQPQPGTLGVVACVSRAFRRVWEFLRRHQWSVPLSGGSAFFFVRLASEVREGDLDSFDRLLQRHIEQWRGTADDLMVAATLAGDVAPMATITVAAVCALLLGKRPREAWYLTIGAGGCLLLNLALKLTFHRARPSPELAYLLPQPSSLSFPSGHAMGSAGVLGSLVVIAYALRVPRGLRWFATVLGISAIATVGASRVYLGAHYPSDVLGGFLAAAAWLAATTGWIYPRLLRGEHNAKAAGSRK
jgi:undecaprenyl-diphosphatase